MTMGVRSEKWVLAAVALLYATALAPAAQAQDFFSALFGGMGRRAPQPHISMPLANENGSIPAPRGGKRARHSGTGGPAFCVRPSDRRPFPAFAFRQCHPAACSPKFFSG